MKVSLNLAQQYSNVNLKAIPHDELVKRVGAQLGAVEEVIDWAPKYQDIIVVKIITCEDHPDADRLHVCMVDDGGKAKDVKRNDKGLVQVVCGAPNVRAGLLVSWIPPGATVPTTYGTDDPFVLEARELRGVVSNGMLASAKELGISDDHGSILEITPEEVGRTPKPGEPLTDYFGLDDFIIDCENKMFTHRPDCFGNLGVAREFAGISGLGFKSPDWYSRQPHFEAKAGVKLNVKNEAGKLLPRLMAIGMKNVTVKKSPVWLQAFLTRVGIKSINNVVDITNFISHLTAQPLHAYDADKLGTTLISRMAKKGETVALLNGKTIELTEDDMVIANDKMVVGLAAIMGGSDTQVDDNTKNIVIECASFDMYTVRRSSMRHGLFTDASTRFTKGQSPLQNDRALAYAMKQMQELAGAEQSSPVYDVHGKLEMPADVTITADFINERLGTKLALKDIAKLLENVEFEIKSVPADKNRLHIRPPFWRTDIEMPEDVVEEVGRLYGYDKVPVVLPSRSAKPTAKNPQAGFKSHLREALKEAGANEVLTYSFVHGDLLRKTGTDPDKSAYHLRNALSPELQYYRTSLMPSLLDKVYSNLRADVVRAEDNSFAIYEIGVGHIKGNLDDEKLPKEMEHIALVFAADQKTAERSYEGAAFYQAKHYLLPLLKEPVEFTPLENDDHPITAPYQLGRSSIMKYKGEVLGVIGEFKQSVKKALKLPDFCAGFEINLNVLAKMNQSINYHSISVFPKAQQDITLEVSSKINFSDVYGLLNKELVEASEEHGYQPTLWPRDIYEAKDSGNKRLTFRLWLSHPSRTLTTDETNRLLDNLAAAAKAELQAERI